MSVLLMTGFKWLFSTKIVRSTMLNLTYYFLSLYFIPLPVDFLPFFLVMIITWCRHITQLNISCSLMIGLRIDCFHRYRVFSGFQITSSKDYAVMMNKLWRPSGHAWWKKHTNLNSILLFYTRCFLRHLGTCFLVYMLWLIIIKEIVYW